MIRSRRIYWIALGILLPVAGCSTYRVAVVVAPSAGVEVLNAVGQTAQFHASETTVTQGSQGSDTHDVTRSVLWVSGNTAVATINSSGLATAVGIGTTVISAQDGGVSGTSNLTVTGSGSTPTSANLRIIPGPGAAVATRAGETTQFLAFGDLTGSGNVQDLTNSVRWVSSDISVATIDQAGLATGQAITSAGNSTTITAIGATSSGAAITATSTLTMEAANQPVLLPTLTIYKTGNGAGVVTSSPGIINCGPQATCTGIFTLGQTVTLTATPSLGSSFAGWSNNCFPTNAPTCTLSVTNNDTVGVIFNTP